MLRMVSFGGVTPPSLNKSQPKPQASQVGFGSVDFVRFGNKDKNITALDMYHIFSYLEEHPELYDPDTNKRFDKQYAFVSRMIQIEMNNLSPDKQSAAYTQLLEDYNLNNPDQLAKINATKKSNPDDIDILLAEQDWLLKSTAVLGAKKTILERRIHNQGRFGNIGKSNE
jgi:hypothetical protein